MPWRGTAAGGGYSTAGDLLKFGQALLDAGWEPEGFAYAEDGTACMSMVWGKFRYWVYFEGGIDQPANWDEMPDCAMAALLTLVRLSRAIQR